jgi:hypothetical protein
MAGLASYLQNTAQIRGSSSSRVARAPVSALCRRCPEPSVWRFWTSMMVNRRISTVWLSQQAKFPWVIPSQSPTQLPTAQGNNGCSSSSNSRRVATVELLLQQFMRRCQLMLVCLAASTTQCWLRLLIAAVLMAMRRCRSQPWTTTRTSSTSTSTRGSTLVSWENSIMLK